MSRSLIIMACLSVGAEAIAKPGMKQLAERFQVGKLATKMLIGGDGSMIGTSGKQTKHTMAEKLDSQDDCDEHTKFKSGRKIGSKTTCTTFAECQKQCSETDDCTEMSWLKAKGWCKLYDGGVGKETEQDTWSGSRTCTLPAGVGGEPTGCPATTAAAGVATVCADSDVDIHVPTQYANTRKDIITCATAEEELYSFQELCAAAGDFGGIVQSQCRVKCGCCLPGEDDPDKDSVPIKCQRLCKVPIDCDSPDTCKDGKCAAPTPRADDTQEEDAGDQGDNTQDEDGGDQADNTQDEDGGDQADNTQDEDAGDQAEGKSEEADAAPDADATACDAEKALKATEATCTAAGAGCDWSEGTIQDITSVPPVNFGVGCAPKTCIDSSKSRCGMKEVHGPKFDMGEATKEEKAAAVKESCGKAGEQDMGTTCKRTCYKFTGGMSCAENTQDEDAGDQAEATPATATTTSCHDNDGAGWISKAEDDGEARTMNCGTIRNAESTGNWVDEVGKAIDPEKWSFKNSCKVTEEEPGKMKAMARPIRQACVKSCGCCGKEEACKDDAIYTRDIWPAVAFP